LGRLAIVVSMACLLLGGCGRDYTVVKAQPKERHKLDRATPPEELASREQSSQYVTDGLILFRQGDNVKARHCFQQALETDGASWLAHYCLGLVLSKDESWDTALDHLRASLEYAPADKRTRSLIHLAMGQVRESQGSYGQARQHYRTALNLHPESSGAAQGLKRIAELSQTGR
jgi:tetratricopeptide (TPR) repeat protein